MEDTYENRVKSYGITFFYTYTGLFIWAFLDEFNLVDFPTEMATKIIDVGLGLFFLTICYECSRALISVIADILTRISIYYAESKEETQ